MNKGFSLIGVLMATSITAIGLMAVFGLTTMSLMSSKRGEMRLVASGLAQEGIEVIRCIRKSYGDWDNWEWYSTRAIGDQQAYCPYFDTTNLSEAQCPAEEKPLKLYMPTDFYGSYQYDNGDDSSFYRKVTLSRLSQSEVKVVAEVKWQVQGGQWSYLTVEDRLWNWK